MEDFTVAYGPAFKALGLEAILSLDISQHYGPRIKTSTVSYTSKTSKHYLDLFLSVYLSIHLSVYLSIY